MKIINTIQSDRSESQMDLVSSKFLHHHGDSAPRVPRAVHSKVQASPWEHVLWYIKSTVKAQGRTAAGQTYHGDISIKVAKQTRPPSYAIRRACQRLVESMPIVTHHVHGRISPKPWRPVRCHPNPEPKGFASPMSHGLPYHETGGRKPELQN